MMISSLDSPSSTSNGRTLSMARSTMEDWDLSDMSDTNHHATSTTYLQRNIRKFGMTISKQRPAITHLGSPSCLRRDSGMYERRAETMSWSLSLNATTWMLDLGAETRRIELSLRRAALSRSAPANPPPHLHMPFFAPNNQHPTPKPFPRFPTASVFSLPNSHPYLFVVDSSCLRFPSASNVQPCLIPPFAAYTQRTREEGVKEAEPPLREGRTKSI